MSVKWKWKEYTSRRNVSYTNLDDNYGYNCVRSRSIYINSHISNSSEYSCSRVLL
ncbi:hypothetical protein RHMOL_Rhmol08G0148500 [Rhododendron molle]|uniref:Uncharacterized protein n=1 Tax=Rhododendron molle TaxID=49168 RepID=A0ACC0MQJ4_RHOML|nr:hypothetical protein RHMOL_Rhmol08G0148500 [Rhododendron molle]